MFDIVLNLKDGEELDLKGLKLKAAAYASKITNDKEYDEQRDQLKAACLVELKGVPA